MNTIEDYIVIVKNAIPVELCEEILNEYKDSPDLLPATIASGYNTDIRNCYNLNMSLQHVINKNKEKRLELDNKIFNHAANALKIYKDKFKYCDNIKADFGYILLKYGVGNFYAEHTDSFLENPRSLSCSFSLNNDYEGGEFTFFDDKIKYRVDAGDAIMFPSNFMYPHQVKTITSGTRYSIITWFG